MSSGLATPPMEDHMKHAAPRRSTSSSKSSKSAHRSSGSSKRSSTHISTPEHVSHHSHAVVDGRHKRVWKACERCRMKKTKCDGEFPCKRCKDDGLVCTAGTRKKTEYKQLPRGYAEVLENTQFALIATVHKLYAMVRNSQQWELGEPELNDRGQPVIHNIASKLGCIRPSSDMDLPAHSIFPEDEAGLAELAAQLEVQQRIRDEQARAKGELVPSDDRHDRAGSSDIDNCSDYEPDYSGSHQQHQHHVSRRTAAASSAFNGTMTMSPQSFSAVPYGDFDVGSAPGSDGMFTTSSSPTTTVQTSSYSPWSANSRPTSMDITPQFLQQSGALLDMDMLSQGLIESEYGTIKPHLLSGAHHPDAMMGLGDPMIYSGYDAESLRL